MSSSVLTYPVLNITELIQTIINPFINGGFLKKNDIKKHVKKGLKSSTKSTKQKEKYSNLYVPTDADLKAITAVHTKEGIQWYRGEYDEFELPISALSSKNSILNPKYKSIVYYDEDITCAYIDYDNNVKNKIKNIELRQNGKINGITQKGNKYLPYVIVNGVKNIQNSKTELKEFYFKIKGILKKAKNNSDALKNVPLNEINKEADVIYTGIIHDATEF